MKHEDTTSAALIRPFPKPGHSVQLAYLELYRAANGTDEEKAGIGDPALLPRPWDPATILDPELRYAVWCWLDDVVTWLNHEYTWDTTALIPPCWTQHPHLVHEIGVVADQRRRAGIDLTSNTAEEWHRYCLPQFIDRMRQRIKTHCENPHDKWPGRARHNQYLDDTNHRRDAFHADVDTVATPGRPSDRRLGLVNLETGEVTEPR